MVKAKRARKVETLKQPSLYLRLRAPYFYPDICMHGSERGVKLFYKAEYCGDHRLIAPQALPPPAKLWHLRHKNTASLVGRYIQYFPTGSRSIPLSGLRMKSFTQICRSSCVFCVMACCIWRRIFEIEMKFWYHRA